MKSHSFYIGLFVFFLLALAFFIPNNMITGLSIQSCEGCGLLCDNDNECSSGLSCCETLWELGVCHYDSSCPALYDRSKQQSMESFVNPERPRAINNIAWETFGIPLLVVILTVGVAVYITRKTGQ